MTAYEHYDDEQQARLGWSFPASDESVGRVLNAQLDDNGRSPFMWLRLQNGDLFLAVAPKGATYEDCELDSQLPSLRR